MPSYKEIYQQFDAGNPKDTFIGLANARTEPAMESKYGRDDLANAEHFAFTSRLMQERPYLMPPLLFAIPGYYGLKQMGLLTDENTSTPSIDQLDAGYSGMWHGLHGLLR